MLSLREGALDPKLVPAQTQNHLFARLDRLELN
jgi:hypothetical protein